MVCKTTIDVKPAERSQRSHHVRPATPSILPLHMVEPAALGYHVVQPTPPGEAPSAMTNSTSTPSAGSAASRFLPLLLLLFAGSGCSALIYEIVWYQLLQLAMGSTTVSLAFLLATYMGGLCIGSIWLPRFKRARQHPLKVYAALELGIAIFGILVLVLLPLINRVYVAGVSAGL